MRNTRKDETFTYYTLSTVVYCYYHLLKFGLELNGNGQDDSRAAAPVHVAD